MVISNSALVEFARLAVVSQGVLTVVSSNVEISVSAVSAVSSVSKTFSAVTSIAVSSGDGVNF